MSFRERLYEIYKIISDNEPISKPDLAEKVQILMSENSKFILTDMNRLDEVIEVEVGLDRLLETSQNKLVITNKGREWMRKVEEG